MGMPKNLFLVRHGQSEGNLVRRKYEESGNEDVFSPEFLNLHESQYELTTKGVEQAVRAGKWFFDNNFTNFDRMLVSNNVRAMQTAGYLDLPNAEWMQDFNLRERDGGFFNAITPSERDKKYKDQQKFFDTDPFLFRPPSGESIADVGQRIKIILNTLARECDGKNVIIVCHGHVIRCFKIILERMTLWETNKFLLTKEDWGKVPNCSILHYSRGNPLDEKQGLADRFSWVRMIRPAGGGKTEDEFSEIIRRKYSNEQLLEAAKKHRGV